MRVLRCEDIRAADREAQRLGIAGIVLMEHAARALARAVESAQAMCGGRVAIVCGSGNNGGDGYALARLLHEKRDFKIKLVRDKAPDASCVDATANERLAVRLGLWAVRIRS